MSGSDAHDPKLAIVVAAARNGVIGRGGDMPWRQPTDLARFKALTLGKPMVMGRKTFQSIGRVLPGRISIVVTRGGWTPPEGVHVALALDEALDLALALARRDGVDEASIIGGGEIYAQSLPRAETVHLTRIEAEIEGDATFPALGLGWRETHAETVPAGARDDHAMTFSTHERIGPD